MDGPFSFFPGVARTLALLEGGPLRLQVGDSAPAVLDPGSPPFSFAGDQPTAARLLGGPALVLNVMTRCGSLDHAVAYHALAAGDTLPGRAGRALLLCHAGRVHLGTAELGPMDSLLFEAADPDWTLRAAEPSVVYVARFLPATFTDGSGTSGRDRSTP
jgi:environmental stress-induced protein Ves